MWFTRISHGIVGGLAGGLLFGVLMAAWGILPEVGQLIGLSTVMGGVLVHLANSTVIGALFAFLLGRWASPSTGRAAQLGLAYGAAWWVLGPLTLMPLFLGLRVDIHWYLTNVGTQFPSLVGHLIYGATLGWVFARLQCRCEPEAEKGTDEGAPGDTVTA